MGHRRFKVLDTFRSCGIIAFQYVEPTLFRPALQTRGRTRSPSVSYL